MTHRPYLGPSDAGTVGMGLFFPVPVLQRGAEKEFEMPHVAHAFHSLSQKLVGWFQAFIVSLPNLLLAGVLLTLFWFLSKWAYRMILTVFARTDFNRTLEHLLASMVKVLVMSIGVVLALSILQLEKTVFSMLAGVGVIGLALGFAFQDLASNFISGIMIAVRAPMRVNDIVKIGDVTGTVVDLRLRDTVIRNFDGQEVFVPNKSFMTDTFANFSTYGKQKITLTVPLLYGNDIQAACELLESAMKQVGELEKDPAVAVMADNFGDHAVAVNIYAWVKFPGGNIGLAKHQMITAAKTALEGKGFTLSSDEPFYEWLGKGVEQRRHGGWPVPSQA